MAVNNSQIFLALILSGLSMVATANTPEKKPVSTMSPMPASWHQLSTEQRRDLLNAYQSLRQLDDKDKQDLQQRMDWFSQLPKDQQQRMRDAWQNMSGTEREHWKSQLKTASAEQRDLMREKILEKYD